MKFSILGRSRDRTGDGQKTFPLGLLLSALTISIFLLSSVAWYIKHSQTVLTTIQEQDLRILELGHTTAYIDEVLTMSARMAASTGDLKWEKRYHRYELELNDAMQALLRVNVEPGHNEVARKVDQANQQLIDLESQAFRLIHAGRRQAAANLLNASAYAGQKRVYSDGVRELVLMTKVRVHSQILAYRSQALGVGVVFALCLPMFLALWQWFFRALGRYLAMQKSHSSDLERLVKERNSNLVRTNKFLSQEVAEHRRTEVRRRKLEAQLEEIRKMEAIGTLAAGIAHDFNNMLTGIIGNADMIKVMAGQNNEIQAAATDILKAASRSAKFTSQLLGFAQRGRQQNIAIDMHGLIHETSRSLAENAPVKMQTQIELSPDTLLTQGDPNQIRQLFLNIFTNAQEAMPQGGKLTIKTSAVQCTAEDLSAEKGLTPGTYVKISVLDTGCGISSEVLPHIFEPYFTTKQNSKSTGMGLAMVYGIVANHGGFVRFSSEFSVGTQFDVYLPLFKGAKSQNMEAGPDVLRHKGQVIVVDDEEIVARIAERILAQHGYEVLVFNDPTAAVSYYRENPESTAVFLLDMMMPQMTGKECFQELKKIQGDVTAVFTTGYSLDVFTQEENEAGVVGLLPKPYKALDLARLVATAFSTQLQC